VTLRPTRLFRWVYPIFFVALAGGELTSASQDVLRGENVGAALILSASAAVFIAAAAVVRAAYIRVDDSRIVFGPKVLRFGGRVLPPTFNRREVAGIRATPSPFTRRTLLLRPDGSTLWSMPGTLWGRDGLQLLADYLGVPFDGWSPART
jgi:hypothetical protein